MERSWEVVLEKMKELENPKGRMSVQKEVDLGDMFNSTEKMTGRMRNAINIWKKQHVAFAYGHFGQQSCVLHITFRLI